MNKLELQWWEDIADIYDKISDNPEAYINYYTCDIICVEAYDVYDCYVSELFLRKLKAIWSWRGEYGNTSLPIPGLLNGLVKGPERTADAVYHFAVYMADEIRTLLEGCDSE